MKRVKDRNNSEWYEVNLKELKKLNIISSNLEYNRNLDDECYELISKYKSPKFLLNSLMVHNHKQGVLCDPHFRYLVYQIDNKKIVNTYFLDLPLISIKDLLN